MTLKNKVPIVVLLASLGNQPLVSAATNPIDFIGLFNQDSVRSTAYDNGQFDGWAALITQSFADREGHTGQGVPDNGVFPATPIHPEFLLSDFASDINNVWQVTGTPSRTVAIVSEPYKELHIAASAGGGGVGKFAKFTVTAQYSDGSSETSEELIVPDWFDDSGIEQNYVDDTIKRYYLKDGMDRVVNTGSYENSNDAAIFGFRIPLKQQDGTKNVEQLTFNITSNNGGVFNFFGGMGTTTDYSEPVLPPVEAPPVIENFDEIIFVEGVPEQIAPTIKLTNPNNTGFDGGNLKVSISGSDADDFLSISSSGVDTERNAISVDGSVIYIGSGPVLSGSPFKAPVADIDPVNNGQNGKPLEIVFRTNDESVLLKNASFESGLTHWVKDIAPGSFTTENDSHQYDDKDGNFLKGTCPDDYDPANLGTMEVEVDNTKSTEGSQSARLYIDSAHVLSAYGCKYGPSLTSSEFSSIQGARVSVDWAAALTNDEYLVKAQVISGAISYDLFMEKGANRDFGTTELILPVSATDFQFKFRGGSFDETGGQLVGAELHVDNITIALNTPEVINAIAQAIHYQGNLVKDGRYRDMTLSVTDKGGEASSKQVRFHAQHAPAVSDYSYTIGEHDRIVIPMSYSDIDEQHTIEDSHVDAGFTFTHTTPVHGSLNLDGNVYIYTPTSAGTDIGITDTFSYTVIDPSGFSSTGTISVTIYKDSDKDGTPDKDENDGEDGDPSKFPDYDNDGIPDIRDPDIAPVPTEFLIGTNNYFKILENKKFVAQIKTVNAISSPTFSISGGADSDLLYINEFTGELSFNNSPDWDAPEDGGKDNKYQVTVTASDSVGAVTAMQDITIEVISDPDEVEPGDSRSGEKRGELFLGGKYIELGISDWGDFGSSESKPTGFYGTSSRNNIGMSNDVDGFGAGDDRRMDYFLPGSPEERFTVAYKDKDGNPQFKANADVQRQRQMSTTVQDISDLANKSLGAKIKSVWEDRLIVQQKVTFNEQDKFFRNEVTLSNVSSEDMNDVRFVRSFDPDNTVDQGGSYSTNNVVEYNHSSGELCQDAEDTSDLDCKAVVRATVLSSDSFGNDIDSELPIFFYSKNPKVRASIYPTLVVSNPYSDIVWDKPSSINYVVIADNAITMTYREETLAAGESVVFVYYTSLDERDFDDIEKDIEDDDKKTPEPVPEPIVVPPVLNIDGTPTDKALQDQFYTFTPVVAEPDGWTINYVVEGEPSWLAVDAATGQLSGTPRNADVGAHTGIKLIAKGAHFSGSTSEDFIGPFTIVVSNVNDAPYFTDDLRPEIFVDESDSAEATEPSFTYTPHLTDIDAGDWAKYSVNDLPSWANFSIVDGTVSGTPGYTDAGIYTVTITAEDAAGEASLNNVALTINVVNVNRAPELISMRDYEVTEGTTVINELFAVDPDDGDTIYYHVIPGEDAELFTIDESNRLILADNVKGDVEGSRYYVDLAVTNDNDPDTETNIRFSVNVLKDSDGDGSPDRDDPHPHDPGKFPDQDEDGIPDHKEKNTPSFDIVSPSSVKIYENEIEVTQLKTLNPGEGAIFSLVPGFESALFKVEKDVLEFKIAPDYEASSNNRYKVMVEARSGDLSVEKLIEVYVMDVDETPNAKDDNIGFVNAGVVVSVDVLKNDTDPYAQNLKIVGATSRDATITAIDEKLHFQVDSNFSGEGKISYTIENIGGYQDEAVVSFEVKVSEGTNPIDIIVPPPVNVFSKGLFTKVDLTQHGDPIAYDRFGNQVPISLVDGVTQFAPGDNLAVWSASDSEGNSSSESQNVTVMPLASIEGSVEARPGETVDVGVYLNGKLPNDVGDLIIPARYSVTYSDGPPAMSQDFEFVVENQSTSGFTHIELPNNTEQLESISITLFCDAERTTSTCRIEEHDVNLGVNTSMQVYVTDEVEPRLTLMVLQGDQPQAVVDLKSDIFLSARVENAIYAEEYTYRYSLNGNEAKEPSDKGESLNVHLDGLATGMHTIELEVINQTSVSNVSNSAIYHFEVVAALPILGNRDTDGDGLMDSEEGFSDSDLDGIPDYLDVIGECNVLQGYSGDSHRLLLESKPGTCASRGEYALTAKSGGSVVEEVDLSPDLGSDLVGGIHDFVISDLATPGDYAQVVIPQVLPIPEGAVYRKYSQGIWSTVVTDNTPGSDIVLLSTAGEPGFCPPPSNEASDVWSAGLTTGHWCVLVSIKDGGLYDDDSETNGMVIDPGSVALPVGYNGIPAVNDDFYHTHSDQTIYLNVLDNDSDPDGHSFELDSVGIDSLHNQVNLASENVWIESESMIAVKLPAYISGEVSILYTVRDELGGFATGAALVSITNADDNKVVGESSAGGSIGWITLLFAGVIGLRKKKVA